MSALLELYTAGDSDVHEYVTVERPMMRTVSAMPVWAAKH